MRTIQIYYAPADAGVESSASTEEHSLGNGAGSYADNNTLQTLREFDAWVDAGYGGEVIPLQHGDKVLYELEWSTREWPVDLVREKVANGANVGLRLSRWAVFDVEDTPLGELFLKALRKRFPNAPMRSRPGSRSKALLVALESPAAEWQVLDELHDENGARVLDEKGRPVSRYLVELLTGNGAQLHILGHRADCGGVRLQWENMTPAPFLTPVSPEELIEIRDEMAQIARDAGCVGVTTTSPLMARVGGRSPASLYPAQQWIEPEILIEALECLENDRDWCDIDTWMTLAFAVGRLSGGNEEVECEFFNWSLRPRYAKHEKTNNLFRDAREGKVVTPPGPAAGLLARFLREHPARGRVKRAEQLAERITRGVDVPLAIEALGPTPDGADGADEDAASKPKSIAERWDDSMKGLRAARHEVGQDDEDYGDDLLVELTALDSEPVVRPDVTDRHSRTEATMLAADGGVGKSTWSLLMAFAIALNRPELIGQKSFDWLGDVVFVSNEDGVKTAHRVWKALKQHHGVTNADFRHKVHMWREDQLSLVVNTGAAIEPSPDAFRLVERLTELRKQQSIAIVVFDTLASVSEGVEENSSKEMGPVLRIARQIARNAFCSVELIHHQKKGASANTTMSAGDARGSTTIVNSVRAQAGFQKVNVAWAQKEFGWSEQQCLNRVRMSGTKANGRALSAEQFYEFRGVVIQAKDPRAPDALTAQEVGILVHIEKPARGDFLPRAYDALKKAHDNGIVIEKASKTGPGGAKSAKTIIAAATGVTPAVAHEAVEEMLQKEWLVESEIRDANRNTKKILTPVRVDTAPPAEDDPFAA